MIYITNALYLGAASASVSSQDIPLIGWKSVLTREAFTSPDGTGAGVMWSPSTYTYWQSDSKVGSEGAEFIINLDNPAATPVDYIGIAAHNFYSNDSGVPYSFVLEHSFDGETWTESFDPITPENANAIFVHFDAVAAQFFRLVVTSANELETFVRISHLRLGQVLKLQRKMYVGMSPFTLSRRTDKMVTVSDSGKYLGSVAKSTVNLYAVTQPDNTPAFVRSDVMPFLEHADLIGTEGTEGPDGTFFAAWRPTEYPNEVLYCHPPEQIQWPTNTRPNGLMQWAISGEAEA